MSNPLSKGNLFDPHIVSDMINLVKGKSSLAALSGQTPVAFCGNKEFTFTMDSEIDIVAENGAKSHGGVTVQPVTIVPIKFEYGARVSDEFMYAAEEDRIAILQSFADGFARKVAYGLDLAAIHGVNPRTRAHSVVVGNNHFGYAAEEITYETAAPDASIEEAVAYVEGTGNDVTGVIIGTDVRAALAAMKSTDGNRLYPEFAFGGKPATLGASALEVNKSVNAFNDGKALVGDFANGFKWGYAKEIPLEVIEYGNPDNSDLGDLKGHNQVYLRSEIYLGWAIVNPDAFALVKVTNT